MPRDVDNMQKDAMPSLLVCSIYPDICILSTEAHVVTDLLIIGGHSWPDTCQYGCHCMTRMDCRV